MSDRSSSEAARSPNQWREQPISQEVVWPDITAVHGGPHVGLGLQGAGDQGGFVDLDVRGKAFSSRSLLCPASP